MVSNAALEGILASLNQQQRVAVRFDHTKALQVIAGPGTGKTKVLTSRVAYLLLHHRIKPQDIIVTTFTNKAAKEMIDRLTVMLTGTSLRVSDIMIGTFHSVCLKILTRFGHKIGLRKDWRIVDESEVDKIMQEMIEKMPDAIRDQANSMARKVNLCLPKRGTDEWAVHAKPVKKHISRLKAYAILPEEYTKDSNHDQALAYFYEKYQTELGKLNALDFDDLLMYAFRLLSRERCLPYIQHVLVDEFQDTNGIQMDLMFLFARANHHLSRGITVVGDPDQSIYAFRHALALNFDAMSNKCPIECSRVVLVENYRSSQRILNTSETLIKQQLKGRADRLPLHAQFDCEFAPVYIDFPATFLEGPSLIREMLYLKALPNLFTYNDFAILVRQRRQIKNIETALIEHGIPYKIIRGHAFWELKEVIAMLNLLKCTFSENERLAIFSALQYPARGLGAATAGKIKTALDAFSGSALQGLKQICNKTINLSMPAKARSAVKEFISMIDDCQTLSQNTTSTTLSNIFDRLYEGSGMRHEYLYFDGRKKSEANGEQEPNFSNARHKNVMILKNYFTGSDMTSLETSTGSNLAETKSEPRSRESLVPGKSGVKNHIRNFFLSLSLFSTDSNDSELDNAKRAEQESIGFVTISTIHGAKGLEWPVVFIPGCEEGIIPSVFGDEKAQEGGEDEDDEEKEVNDNKECQEDAKTNNKTTVSPNSKVLNADSSLDEERRMFFVAQTRAKHLLYHSATDSGRSDGPSRFLTGELLGTMADQQRLFDSVASIKKFYVDMGKKLPSEGKFQLKRLVEDYAKFIENRRERFVWSGEIIAHTFKFDLSKNVDTNSGSSFTTAAAQLQNSAALTAERQSSFGNSAHCRRSSSPTRKLYSTSSSPRKTFAPQIKVKGELSPTSPVKAFAPSSQTASPGKKRSFAPSYKPTRNAPNALQCNRKLFAPGQDTPKLKSETSGSSSSGDSNSLSSNHCLSNTNQNEWNPTEKTSHNAKLVKMENEEEREAFVSTFKKSYHPQRSKRRLIAAPIDISDSEAFSGFKADNKTPDYSLLSENDDGINTTAAELLHNPDDMMIDTRPIIANAKTLADAARKSNRAEIDKDTSQKVKAESSSSQIDIFSQLSRAKKKTKLSDGEIIIID